VYNLRIFGLHKRGGMGTEVTQRGPEEKPRYEVSETKSPRCWWHFRVKGVFLRQIRQ